MTTTSTQESTALAVQSPPSPAGTRTLAVFSSIDAFQSAQRMAQALASSTIVPPDYQGQTGLANCLVALELAGRMNLSPLEVMQNVSVINGRPSWSSSFLIASVNNCGRFSPLEFVFDDEDNPTSCYCIATDLQSGKVLRGSKITMEMADAEGWLSRKGSKWKTMPEQMLSLRAAAFWTRRHYPAVGMGMRTQEEAIDIQTVSVDTEPASAPAPAPAPAAQVFATPPVVEPAPAPDPEPEAPAAAEPDQPLDVVMVEPEPAPPEPAPPEPEPEPEPAPPAAETDPEPEPEDPRAARIRDTIARVDTVLLASHLKQSTESLAQAVKDHRLSIKEGKRIQAAIDARALVLQKAAPAAARAEAKKLIAGRLDIDEQFRQAFEVDAETPIADAIKQVQHVEFVKFLLSQEPAA